ncbi:hypothetical protein EYF80_013045 [Liparis tanakae]|uniref:Uncharacterized protein n=1 Tax=Liparis tanakae TaxID=230148 RepID=A0A4Z2IFQ0_9TELE|nr:hypothetical protein EYF80_013045 [Liparis tanakae]
MVAGPTVDTEALLKHERSFVFSFSSIAGDSSLGCQKTRQRQQWQGLITLCPHIHQGYVLTTHLKSLSRLHNIHLASSNLSHGDEIQANSSLFLR